MPLYVRRGWVLSNLFFYLINVKCVLRNPSAPGPEQTSFGSCCPRLRWRKLLLVHVVRGSDEENCFWFISSEAQMEQTSFGSCCPRLGWRKLLLVHIVRGSDGENCFWFISSEDRPEERSSYSSCRSSRQS